MPLRPPHILEDTTIVLELEGIKKAFHTKYNSQLQKHTVTCDICNTSITLSATANPRCFLQHHKACKRKKEKQEAKKFRISEPVLGPDGTLGLRLFFDHPPASIESHNHTTPAVRAFASTEVECPGQWVQWSPGSIWESYPFRLHKSKDVGWMPIGIDDANNGLVIRAKLCWKMLQEVDGEDEPSPCFVCKEVPHTTEFKAVVERAHYAKEHTPWMYLTDLQKETLMRQMALMIRRLRAQIIKGARSRRILSSKIQEYKRIMMLIASNDIPRLNQLLSVSLSHGSSAKAIAIQIERAVDGLYSPQGGFTQRDIDVTFLCQAIGGRRLLYALSKSHGLPSETTVRRTKIVPRLLPSVGVPTPEEIKQNITAFLDPLIKPPPPTVNDQLPGNILGFDGISIEKKCRYCPKRGLVLGLCRKHSQNVNTNVTDGTVVDKMWAALKSADGTKKVCWGSEATVVVVAPYSRSDYYCPTPLVLSPTDKSEKADGLAQWIKTVISAWNTHENGARQHGPIWSIASDGDATFRRARHDLCCQQQLDSHTPLGQKLEPLLGFNRYTSNEIITATCDPKHIFKRFATLIRGTGMTVKGQLISRDDIREQLMHLQLNFNEINDLLNTEDKQNVPKAVQLLRYLGTLSSMPSPTSEFSHLRYEHVCFIANFFAFFLEPFVDVNMSLSHQLQSLSTFSHLAVALQLENGAACLTGPLYADTQAIIKNIFFVVARLQLISPDLTLYIIHEGTDRLERLFGDCRTLDHGRNFDILQLSEKMAIASLINSAYERNPDLDRGHRRLNVSSTIGVDHVNPGLWLGDTRVGGVNLTAVWDAGRDAAMKILESFFGSDKTQTKFNFQQIFSTSNRDVLRPNGTYIGLRMIKEDVCLNQQTDISQPQYSIPQKTNNDKIAIEGTLVTDNIDITSEALDLESSLADDPEEELSPLQSLLINGTPVKIDSLISSIHPNSWRQMSDRIFRVRGWNLDQFNTHQVNGLVDAKDVVNSELLKAYDIIGILVRVDDDVCLAVIEVTGVSWSDGEKKKKLFSLSAQYSELTSPTSNIVVLGQIIKLVPSVKQKGYWEWAREYISPRGDQKSKKRGRKESLTIEVPSYMIFPLEVHMISYPNETREKRLRWALSVDELEKQMWEAWNFLSSELENELSKFDSIPIIDNSASLPYRNKNVKGALRLTPDAIVHCLVCGVEKELRLMRAHVGKHILLDMRCQKEESSIPDFEPLVGIMPCGFCGLDGCQMTLINQPNGAGPTIRSTCIYYITLDASSETDDDGIVCTNVPIHCDMCPLSPKGQPQTIWKYNALMHILIDHREVDSQDPNLCILPDVPIPMQVKIRISRAEETALGIKEELTSETREDYHLLNSDDLPHGVTGDGIVGKRPRTDTQSTIKPPSKKFHF